MAIQGRLQATPTVYVIGEDISEEQYNQLIQKLGDWFSKVRKTKEPVKLAIATVDACLRGVKPSDPTTPWASAANASLGKRIRMACRFDLDTMSPIKVANEKTRERRLKRYERDKEKRRSAKKDRNYPAEFALPSATNAAYGDDPAVFFTSAELESKDRKRAALLQQFPQLDSVASETKVEMWLTLQLLFERLQFRKLTEGVRTKDVAVTERAMADMTKQIVDLEKAMGIDPVSVSKMQKEREGGTVGDAVRRFEDLGDWKALRERQFAEELLLIYQMYMMPSPRGGYQLDEVGLYGLTKTRVVTCPHCHRKNFAGLALEEVEEWLKRKGYLTEVVDAGD